MAEKTKEVGIRLSVKDADVAKRALQQFGVEGQAALKRIESAGHPASASLANLSAAVDKSKEVGTEAFTALAMGALAPIAAFLSVEGAIEGVRAAIEDFSKVNDEARAAALDPEFFQGLTYQAGLSGISIDQMSKALDTFAKSSGQAETNTGRMVTQLKLLDPALLKAIQSTSSQEERVKLVADAIDRETDASRKAAIIAATFGADMQKLGDAFDGGRASIERFQRQARDIGIVVPDDMIANADELGDKLDTASRVIDTNFKEALISLAPVIASASGWLADLAKNTGIVIDQFRDVDSRIFLAPLQNNLVSLENDIASTKEQIKSMRDWANSQPDWNPLKGINLGQADALEKGLEDKYKAAQDYQDRIAQLQGMGRTPPASAPAPSITPDPASLRAAEQAQKKIDEVNKSLDLQIKNLGETNREQQINNELSRAGVTIDSAAGKAIAEKAGKLYDLKQAYDDANEAAGYFADEAESGIENLISGTESLSDAVSSLANDFLKATLQAELLGEGPLAGILGTSSQTSGATGGLFGEIASWFTHPAAKGDVFVGRGISQFSSSIVDQPTIFPMATGAGLIGEAGPEGVLPLRRGADGRLGVNASVTAPTINVINQTGVAVNPTIKQSSNGVDFDLMLAPIVTKRGGKTARNMQVAYGLQRQVTRRGS